VKDLFSPRPRIEESAKIPNECAVPRVEKNYNVLDHLAQWNSWDLEEKEKSVQKW
jgi:hypothetical protein